MWRNQVLQKNGNIWRPSGFWHRAVLYVGTIFSKEHTVSIHKTKWGQICRISTCENSPLTNHKSYKSKLYCRRY
jgi:hypothetical protein